jgi:hypothetical protein
MTMLILIHKGDRHEGRDHDGSDRVNACRPVSRLTASFAQNFVTYSSAYGKAAAIDEMAPIADGITASDRGYQGAWRQHRSHTDRR